MMAEKIDPEIVALLKGSGLGNDAVWKHKQSGQYIVYHWALEEVAAKRGIAFDPPLVVHADPGGKLAVICVTGRMGDKAEWSFGEAAPYNTQQSYPFAMAEKRGKDRVILKLLNLHGRLYSEEEADDFRSVTTDGRGNPVNRNNKTSRDPDWHGPLKKVELQTNMRAFFELIGKCDNADRLQQLIDEYAAVLDQCRLDQPGWMTGDGMPEEFVPGNARIEAKRRFLNVVGA